MRNKSVTVVLLTYNSGQVIQNYLNSCPTEEFDLVAIDSSSADTTIDILNESKWCVHTINKFVFDHGGTRNYAAQLALTDIVVFTTHDIVFADEHSIENLVKAFDDPSVGAAYGRQLPHTNADFFAKRLRAFNYGPESHIRTYSDRREFGFKTAFLSDSFSAYRKSVLEEVGGFANPIIFGEDSEIASRILRAGYKIAYRADACVYHSHNYTPIQELRRYFDVGVFHQQYDGLLKEFGKPESEGVKYVAKEMRELIHVGKWYLVPYSICMNGMKYIGYKLGKGYRRLPKRLVKKISMNKGYWK